VTTALELGELSAATTGEPTVITATLTDYFGDPVSGAAVEFFASGAPIGTADSNQEGVARLSYRPLSQGEFPITASFEGDPKYLSSVSAGSKRLVVQGETVQPPQIMEAMAENNILVRVFVTPTTAEQNDNSSIRFSVEFVDPRTETEIPNLPYTVEITRENEVLYSRSALSGSGSSAHEHSFDEFGPAEIVVKEINNSEANVRYSVNIVPEFPIHAALIPILAFAAVIAVVRRMRTLRGGLSAP
jgi:hypothetical protein